MKPFDPRLLHHARATRGFLVLSAALGVAQVSLVIAQAALLARCIAAVFQGGASPHDLPLLWLAVVIAGRALITWLQELSAFRASAAVKSELRSALLRRVVQLGPAWLHGERSGEVATLATRGLDSLDAYFARYLPQVVLAALVPCAVLAYLLPIDTVAFITILVTLPLIPLFLALVGLTTEKLNQRQLSALSRLAHHLVEVVAGLPTLKVFGRAKAQAQLIRSLTDDQRRLTMRTLRLAFLSSLVLELLSTISLAMVAVGIGLRVVSGDLGLQTALVVLILAPEAYLPLRQLGAQYHASAEGLAAATRVFEILETPLPTAGTRRSIPLPAPVALDEVSVTYPGRPALPPVSLTLHPGELVALTGPSGAGKSTLVNVLLGFLTPTSGRVVVGSVDLSTLDPHAWRSAIAYVPQRPYLFAGTVAENITLGALVDPANAAAAARLDVPLSTVVGEGGVGLSAGQRQRVALARALLRDAPLVVLDEPTANLDPGTEAGLIDTITSLVPTHTVLVVAHRPALVAAATREIALDREPLVAAR